MPETTAPGPDDLPELTDTERVAKEEMEKGLRCLFLEVPESVGKDVSRRVHDYVDRLEKRLAEVEEDRRRQDESTIKRSITGDGEHRRYESVVEMLADQSRREIIDLESQLAAARPVRPAGEVGEALARWKLHKATDMKYTPLSNPYAIVAFHDLCGFRWDLTMMDEDKELLAAAFAAQFEGESA